jgi:hypothetical protein
MAESNTTKQEREIYSKLNKITDNTIYEWLDNIKKGPPFVDNLLRVDNPLSKSKIYTNTKGGIYPIIIKWCFENYKGYDFTDIPNIKEILGNITGVAASGVAASGVASSSGDIISILKDWKENPTKDPYTGKTIVISIKDNSDYVELYKYTIDKLIKHIFKNKQGQSKDDILSIQDCRDIKEAMPNIHSKADIKDANNNIIDTIYYDYLFMKYFLDANIKIKTRTVSKYKYESDYYKDIEPYLYLIIYDTMKESFAGISMKTQTIFNTTEELLKSRYLNLSRYQQGQYQLGSFVEKLCVDIKNILYMHESKISADKINLAIFNKEVLKYMLSIVKLKSTNLDIRNELSQYYNDSYHIIVNGRYALKREIINSNTNRNSPQNNIYYIYTQIDEHIAKDGNICKTLIDVYDTILKLYGDNNIKNTVFKYVKDPYNLTKNKGVEPNIPRKAQLPIDLQKYKMLSSAKDAVKDSENERILREYEEKWKIQLKEYEKKKDIYDRLYEGKVSIKHNKWDGDLFKKPKKMNKSEDNRKPPSVSLIKYSKKIKAFTSASHNNKSGSSNKIDYVNDSDPYTQELFEDMHPNKQKYTSDIVYLNPDNNKTYHLRFDTVSIYNYILKCIEDCKKPMNFYYSNSELTNENLNEICSKIKHFTKKPTYNSHLDIRALLDNCKYENRLALNYKQVYLPQHTSNPIIGYLKIYLNVDLGGILFRVINSIPHIDPILPLHPPLRPQSPLYDNFPNQTNIMNSEVLVLPLFTNENWFYDIYKEQDYVYPVNILTELQQILPKGNILGTKYFPYRKNNDDKQRWKTILKLPKFDLNISDDADFAFKKLKDYKDKLLALF